MEEALNIKNILNAIIFSGVGLVAFALSYIVFDLITPKVSIWKEIVEKENMAVAVFLGSMFIGMALIIASAVHS